MGIVNWDIVWNSDMIATSRTRLDSGRFWDEVASKGKDIDLPSEITLRQLELISPSMEKSILEIGPGRGRLTIPMARASSHLIAVDPSAVMMGHLRKRARDEGVQNISFVNRNWKDIDPSTLDRRPDIIVGAFSIFMLDISVQLRRMSDLASERVLLFLPGDPRIPPQVQKIMFGSNVTSGMGDHALLYNVLCDMGKDANVEMMSHTSRRTFGSMEEAVGDLAEFYNVPEAKMSGFRLHVAGILKEEEGGFLLERNRRTACVWWWTK